MTDTSIQKFNLKKNRVPVKKDRAATELNFTVYFTHTIKENLRNKRNLIKSTILLSARLSIILAQQFDHCHFLEVLQQSHYFSVC